MMTGFDEMQKASKDQVDVAVQSADAVSKAMQALAAETADYSKKSFDAGSAAFGQLIAAPSVDKAVAVQSDFMRSAYESYVGQMNKVGSIFADMAKGAYKPYEGLFGRYGK